MRHVDKHTNQVAKPLLYHAKTVATVGHVKAGALIFKHKALFNKKKSNSLSKNLKRKLGLGMTHSVPNILLV